MHQLVRACAVFVVAIERMNTLGIEWNCEPVGLWVRSMGIEVMVSGKVVPGQLRLEFQMVYKSCICAQNLEENG